MKRKKNKNKKNNKKILRAVEERVGMISVWYGVWGEGIG